MAASTGSDAITADNYVKLACQHIRANGGSGFVICDAVGADKCDRPETPDQWRAWLTYFASIGFATVFAQKQGVMTVPTEWPWLFSPSAPTDIPPLRLAADPAFGKHEITDDERDRNKVKLARLLQDLHRPSEAAE